MDSLVDGTGGGNMYDLLIKNGRIADGSGMPSYIADVGVIDGQIIDIGHLDATAHQAIDATGLVVAPGFIDNHCHFDAQVTWDPLCTYSPQHGVTTVIFGNCSLTLAPTKIEDREDLAMMLSRVEAIPMESLQEGIPWEWTSFGEYLDFIDQGLGINAGSLVGHSAIRRWVMGEDAYVREVATESELNEMKALIKDSIKAGALGVSFNRNRGHMDLLGRPIPGIVPPVDELYELATALKDVGSGVIQCGAAYPLEIRDGFATKLSELSQRPVIYNQIVHNSNEPDRWRMHLDLVQERIGQGYQVYPVVNPRPSAQRFTMRNAQIFDRLPAWRTIMLGSVEEKISAFKDMSLREQLRAQAVEGKDLPMGALPIKWDRIFITRTLKESNRQFQGMSVAQMAESQGKEILNGFLDLMIDEKMGTGLQNSQQGADGGVMAALISSPYTLIGLSDAGAHVVFEAGYGYSTVVLGRWVREEKALSLEEAVRKLTFMQASLYGLHDRGLIRPGFNADIVVFDPETVGAREPEEVADLPGGLNRLKQEAIGVLYTIVNGEILLKDGVHTGALPGRVARSKSIAFA